MTESEKYAKLLKYVQLIAMLNYELEDHSELWKNATTVQDGIDYADTENAVSARKLLKEIGEWVDE